jgi:hypothetical protein
MSVGLISIATAVPSLLVGLVIGVFVDRYDRKKIMLASDLLRVRAVLVFLIPILCRYRIGWLYVLSFLPAPAIDKFLRPVHESVLPETAPDEELASTGVDEQTLKNLRSSTPGMASDASQELVPAVTQRLQPLAAEAKSPVSHLEFFSRYGLLQATPARSGVSCPLSMGGDLMDLLCWGQKH